VVGGEQGAAALSVFDRAMSRVKVVPDGGEDGKKKKAPGAGAGAGAGRDQQTLPDTSLTRSMKPRFVELNGIL
jgi:hypothetical protein